MSGPTTDAARMGSVLWQARNVRLKQCRFGALMYLVTDKFIGQGLDKYGELSWAEGKLFEKLVRPGMTVLDIGANIGAQTVCFASQTGPTGRIFAFEPQRFLYQMLCGNVALNGITHVQAFNAAVGRQPGWINVPSPNYDAIGNFGGVTLTAGSGGETVRMMTVDSLGLAQCHFMKIDVEGMEEDVLTGAEETIRRVKPLLYVENDRREKSPALIDRLFSLDYRLYWYLAPSFDPRNFFGEKDNIFGSIVSRNLLCLPRTAAVTVRGLTEIISRDAW